MPLTDFIRYLNAQFPFSPAGRPFVSEDGHIVVYFDSIRIESSFSPIVDIASGKLRGHAAQLCATQITDHLPLGPEAVFTLPRDDAEFIFLDRLVRTLHTLNYLTYRDRRSRGLLLLKVHPRHVASVAADHGLAFEEILRACGLLPEQITLELELGGVVDTAHFKRAIANYKSRGYGIAVDDFDRQTLDSSLLSEIRPAIIKLAAGAEIALQHWLDRLHALDVQVMTDGPDTIELRRNARSSGFDLLQVQEPLRRLLHAPVDSCHSLPGLPKAA